MSLMLRAHYNFDATFILFARHLKYFFMKSKFKNFAKSKDAFEKHADDVTFGIRSSPKFLMLCVNKKKLKVRVKPPQKFKSFKRYLKKLGGGIYTPPSKPLPLLV